MYPSANPCACDLVGLRGGTVTGEAISGALTQISVLVRGDETSAQSAQATSPPGRQVLALARRSQASPVSLHGLGHLSTGAARKITWEGPEFWCLQSQTASCPNQGPPFVVRVQWSRPVG